MVAQLSAHFPYHLPLTNPDPNHNNLTNSVFLQKNQILLSANSKAVECRTPEMSSKNWLIAQR